MRKAGSCGLGTRTAGRDQVEACAAILNKGRAGYPSCSRGIWLLPLLFPSTRASAVYSEVRKIDICLISGKEMGVRHMLILKLVPRSKWMFQQQALVSTDFLRPRL